FVAAADPDDQLADELDAAEALYGLYSIAIGMTEEADWDFGRFLHPDAAAWFGYVDDAGSFYDRGPGFADEDVSYARARVLVADMLDRIEGWLADEFPYPVTLRFSHAQALMPLAAFLGIEGSSEGADPDVPFDYDTSTWRAAIASPMSANVQWDVFTNDEGVTLIRMLHQEGEVRFAAACRPWGETRHFYELSEIRRCYGV
ncbi:MAG: histidine-type phosphatase, partial [Gemmatimonadales bacterium]